MSSLPSPPSLRLIGDAALLHGDGTRLLLEDKDALLLAYLAIEGPTPRKTLATLLWPDADEARARANLRQRLFRLRKTAGFDLIEGSDTACLVAQVAVDAGATADGAEGELLASIGESDAAGLAAWLQATRQRRRTQRIEGLHADAARLEGHGQLGQAAAIAQRILRIDPTSEPAHRLAMRLHYLRGDRSAALLAFDRCEQLLKNEVGARPSAETLGLLRTIEQAQAPAWVQGQPLPAAVLLPPRIVGREAQLAAARQAWTRGRCFLFDGEAGSGKSRLLQALLGARTDVVVVRARPGDEAVGSATLARMAEQMAHRWPALRAHPAYAQLLKLSSGSGLDPHGAIRSTGPVAIDFLRAAQACGLAGLMLDDLQFADAASVDAWFDCLDRPVLAGVRFGFASRIAGAVAGERIGRLRLRADTVRIAIPSLGVAQIEELVHSLGLVGTDEAAVAAALALRIGGNPLHVLETIRRALEEHGVLAAHVLDTPTQVLDLLEHRLVLLPDEGLLLVRIAAVAGSDFSAELAAAVSQRDVLELAGAWVALERQGILDEHGFAHDLMLDAALRLLPGPIRRVLHARVADYGTRRGTPPARLAHHWLQAGDSVAALPHLVASARLAWRTGRARETHEAFFHAADIEQERGHPDAAFELLFECSEAMTRLDPGINHSHILPRIRPLARSRQHLARLALVEAGSQYFRGDSAAAAVGLAQAFKLAIASGDRKVEAECMYWAGWGASVLGRLRDAVRQQSACAVLQRSLGLERQAAIADASKLRALQDLGEVRLALAERQRAWPWLAAQGDPVDIASHRIAELANHLALGNVRAVDESAEAAWRAVRDADMRGDKLARSARTMLSVLRRRGRWDGALELHTELAELFGADGLAAPAARGLACECVALHLDLGRTDLALDALQKLELAATSPGRLAWEVAGLRWRYQCATGGPVKLGSTLEQALASEYRPMACELVLAAAEAGATDLAAEHLPALVESCTTAGLRMYLLPLRALHCWLLARDGVAPPPGVSAHEVQADLLGTDVGAALPVCALWLASALGHLGRAQEADAVVRQGAEWLLHRSRLTVPAALHESFRFGNPTHRALLSRHAAPAA